ncbi:beta-sarcoglycan isoform X1 [Euwallacea fornicatus]|uniref:beta-sarcoglycan isoform X1 n=1 Tax=Euwallacea fornicatus TaxID=995702 RepID=UPI00338D6CD2
MTEIGSSSPQPSELLSEENDASSSKETTLLGHKNPKNSFKNAYKSVQEYQKPVPRGRKTFAFWTLVLLLFLSAVGNLLLTMTILGVLRIGNGMQSIELLPEHKVIKFFGDVDLGRIFKQNGVMEGFKGENLEVTAENSSVFVNLYSRLSRVFNKVAVERNGTCFHGLSSFTVENKNKKPLFEASSPNFKNLKNVNVFKGKSIETNKIRSKLDENLKIEGESLHFKGSEGSKLEAREIVWSTDQDIYLKSINGSIVLSGKEGTYVDIQRLPIARLPKNSYLTAQFKICVCMPQGKLFRLPIANVNDPVYCNQADMSAQFNPCM